MSEQTPVNITISKDVIVGKPADLPDGVIERLAAHAECQIFIGLGMYMNSLFGSLLNSMPSPLTEDYRRLSVDTNRHGA